MKSPLCNISLIKVVATCFILVGVLLMIAGQWEGVYAQRVTDTPTPTETTFKVKINGNLNGPNLAKLRMQLQYQAINATKAVKDALCGRTVYITEVKTGKQYLGIIPCNQGGVYILKQRPRELLNYYQFINAKTGKGKTITSKEFGDISTYINKFETYHPLDQCGSCGALAGSAPISPPVFVFPTFPSMSDGQSATSPPLTTPTPPSLMALPLISTAESSLSSPLSPTCTPSPVFTPSPTASMTVIPVQASGSNSKLAGTIKPPTDQLLNGILAYSIYALLLIPLIILAIIWKRLRLS
jgi:hypothetical protein